MPSMQETVACDLIDMPSLPKQHVQAFPLDLADSCQSDEESKPESLFPDVMDCDVLCSPRDQPQPMEVVLVPASTAMEVQSPILWKQQQAVQPSIPEEDSGQDLEQLVVQNVEFYMAANQQSSSALQLVEDVKGLQVADQDAAQASCGDGIGPASRETATTSNSTQMSVNATGYGQLQHDRPPAEQDAAIAGSQHTEDEAPDREDDCAELRNELAKVKAARDELSRQSGQYKGAIAKLEGSLSSRDRHIAQQAAELAQLKASHQQMRQELQTAQIAAGVTPERCRSSFKALQDESSRVHDTAQANETMVRRHTELLEHEAREAAELQDFYQHEHAALLHQCRELTDSLAAEKQRVAKLRDFAEQKQSEVQQLQEERAAFQGEAYHAKERTVDLQAELCHLQQQLQQAVEGVSQARAEAATAAEAHARVGRELTEVKDLGTRMFKQMRGIQHALENQSSLLSKAPEGASLVRSLQEWMLRYQATLQSWSSGAGEDPSSAATSLPAPSQLAGFS